jgi:two-component system response regulator HydG
VPLVSDKEYILVLNDDPAMTKALCRLFQRLGYPVAVAGSHSAALDKMKRMQVRLVVADVDMPGLGGLDFFDRARGVNPDVAVIALGSWRERAREWHLRNGATVVSLTKPPKKELLLAVARKAMSGPAEA